MKIGIPGTKISFGDIESTDVSKSEPSRVSAISDIKSKSVTEVKKKKKKFDKPVSNSSIVWREKDNFTSAVINRKLIKIDIDTFDICLPNGFKMNAKSLEEAKKKATDFLSA